MHFTPFKYDAVENMYFLNSGNIGRSSEKEMLELISPLFVFKGTILNQLS